MFRGKESGRLVFSAEEADFLPSNLSIQNRPISPTLRWLSYVMVAFVVSLLGWAYFGRIDIIVNATGKVVAASRIQTIASVDVASVRAIYVSDGQRVTKGDVLIDLDSGVYDADRKKSENESVAATLQAEKAAALLDAINLSHHPILRRIDGISHEEYQQAESHVSSMYGEFVQKMKKIDEEIRHFRLILPIVSQRASDYKFLLAQNDISSHSYLEKEQLRLDTESQLADAIIQKQALVEETKRAAYDAFTEGRKLSASYSHDVERAGAKTKLLRLIAPISGVVQQLSVHTVGGVVPAAQPLLSIAPEGQRLEIDAAVDNHDAGFVRAGQETYVKIQAFEYTKYGAIPGHVVGISGDAVPDEKKESSAYQLHVGLDRDWLDIGDKKIRIVPGMVVNVEIRTGERRIIEYFLSPILQHSSVSFHER